MQNASTVAERLRRRVLEDISSGALPPGSRLGSERELAEHYRVSRGTLRLVLASLAEAGLVQRLRGRGGGTFISHSKVERDLARVVGVPAYLARQGYKAGSQILATSIGAADTPTRHALGLEENALVVEIRRIRLADGIPISLDHARFPAERFQGLLELPLGGSIYDILAEHFSTSPTDADEILEVVGATDEEAALLAVAEGAPLLSITRTTYDRDGEPFEFSYDLFRADRTRIAMRTPGSGIRRVARRDGAFVELVRASSR